MVFTIFALGPVYLVEVLKRSDTETYIVLVPAMFGLIGTAALLGQRASFPRAKTLVAAITGAGLSLLIMGIVPDVLRTHGLPGLMVPLAVAVGVLFGCALGAMLIPGFTVLQERTDTESRGRIFGGIFTVINAAVAIPLLLAGVISDLIGVARVVAALGAILILIAVAIRWFGWRRLEVLEPEPPGLIANLQRRCRGLMEWAAVAGPGAKLRGLADRSGRAWRRSDASGCHV